MTVFRRRSAATSIMSVLNLLGCAAPFPVRDGEVLEYRAGGADYTNVEWSGENLRICWLGSAAYAISLGEVTVVTDPFFTYHNVFRVVFGTIRSDPAVVDTMTRGLAEPKAVFVGHSHYDHLLDLPEMVKRNGWLDTQIFGSETTKNLLAPHCLRNPFNPVRVGGSLKPVWSGSVTHNSAETAEASLHYRAARVRHAPQLPGIELFPGEVRDALRSVPDRAGQFKEGVTYAFVFRLQRGKTIFNVLFLNAATDTVLPEAMFEEPIDVAILCVPGWKNVPGYPDRLLRRTKPTALIAAHFDDFLQDGRKRKRVVPLADLDGFLRRVRRHLCPSGLNRIIVPNIGAVMRFGKTAPAEAADAPDGTVYRSSAARSTSSS